MLHLLPGSLRRVGLILGALAVLGLATGWVPSALATHEGNDSSTMDMDNGPWGGRD